MAIGCRVPDLQPVVFCASRRRGRDRETVPRYAARVEVRVGRGLSGAVWGVVALLGSGCAWMAGLEELDAVPEGFPVEIAENTGRITVSEASGAVAVDLLFEEEDGARTRWTALRAELLAQGYTEAGEREEKKWTVASFAGPKGKVELGCCPARADRQHLVLVSWWPPAP